MLTAAEEAATGDRVVTLPVAGDTARSGDIDGPGPMDCEDDAGEEELGYTGRRLGAFTTTGESAELDGDPITSRPDPSSCDCG